jgi:biopolymer transport protein ExbB/TolQ
MLAASLPDRSPDIRMTTALRVLEEMIARFSALLFYPALALLIWYALRVIGYLGEGVGDFLILRPRQRQEAARRLREIEFDGTGSLVRELAAVAGDGAQHPAVRRFSRQLAREVERGERRTIAARIRHLAGEFEAELARDVDRVRVLVRVGPCLGLAATLIPLGPGLAALGQGDLETLSSQLVVAFSATVVGLGIGGVGYILSVARARSADLAAGDIELLGEMAAAPARSGDGEICPVEFLPASQEASS